MTTTRTITVTLTDAEVDALDVAVNYWLRDAADFVRHRLGQPGLEDKLALTMAAWSTVMGALEVTA